MKRMLLALGLLWMGVFASAAPQPPKAVIKPGPQKPALAKVSMDCMTCHGSIPKTPIPGARLGYDESMHKRGGNARYANGGGCQRCHTHEGFVEYAITGKTDDKAFVNYPSQPGCFTCHAPHETGTMALRPVPPVKLADGTEVNAGKGNQCATCHMSRVEAAKAVAAVTPKTVNGNWGAHHNPSADMLAGANGYHFPGKTYSSSPHGSVVSDSCVACHMSQPSARYSFSPKVGGHSFSIAGEVHESELANASGCLSCHPGLKAVPGRAVFNFKAKADYDLDGSVEVVQDEVAGLLDRFVNKQGTGYFQKLKTPLYKPDGTWKQPPAEATFSQAEFGALYNYKMVLEDKSLGVHNTTYAIQLLYDAAQALDPSFNTAARP